MRMKPTAIAMLLAAWATAPSPPALAADGACRQTLDLPTADGTGRKLYPSNAEAAESTLRADLAAGAQSKDPLSALRAYARNYFGLQRADLAGPMGWVSFRCGPLGLYEQLNRASQESARALIETYRAEGRYLGELNWRTDPSQRPGLLELLLHANLYDPFEKQALAFLSNAKGDANAATLFSRTLSLIERKTWELTRQQERGQQTQGALGLISDEQAGLSRMPAIVGRINAAREEHVQHGLDVERARFAELKTSLASKAPGPASLLQIDTQTPFAIAALEQASKIALATQRQPLVRRASERGEWLEAGGHWRSAEQYFRFAGSDEHADRLEQRADAEQKQNSDKMIAELEKAKDKFLKSDEEREAFEDDTDALADELGIDLDDF